MLSPVIKTSAVYIMSNVYSLAIRMYANKTTCKTHINNMPSERYFIPIFISFCFLFLASKINSWGDEDDVTLCQKSDLYI